ncbi:MAG TPA: hypothetical protein VHW44_00445 [Pseudonocardiaceae bacterium]|jgi:hypothetical protein|nr:hypothetical protein [Pseudonocardiaceae bacterium]
MRRNVSRTAVDPAQVRQVAARVVQELVAAFPELGTEAVESVVSAATLELAGATAPDRLPAQVRRRARARLEATAGSPTAIQSTSRARRANPSS